MKTKIITEYGDLELIKYDNDITIVNVGHSNRRVNLYVSTKELIELVNNQLVVNNNSDDIIDNSSTGKSLQSTISITSNTIKVRKQSFTRDEVILLLVRLVDQVYEETGTTIEAIKFIQDNLNE